MRRKGFLYPFNTPRHLKLFNTIFNQNRDVHEISDVLTERANKSEHPIHTIVLSDEDICTREDIAPLTRFGDSFDIKVVFTLRRQDLWLESWFLQNIKWQWNPKLSHCTFDEFLSMAEDFHWVHYDSYLDHLKQNFGQENLIVNVHEKTQMPAGPIATFCDSIGLTDRSEFTDGAHVNQSLSPQMSEFLRCLPLHQAPPAIRSRVTDACARIDGKLERESQSSLLMAHGTRVEMMSRYEKGNESVARQFFDRDKLFFDELPDPNSPLADSSLPQDSYKLMEHYVAPLIAALISRELL